ncbi:MAG: hypothetical protein HPY61_13575 [Methanotrichaceae archaeon]|nr:hypothetical protein [Methanotrichaceae archaeon]
MIRWHLSLILVLIISSGAAMSQDENIINATSIKNASIDISEEKSVYLSDLGAYRASFYEVEYDSKASMKIGNVEYNKGIQLYDNHASGGEYDAYFNLNGEYSRLVGLLGLDDNTYNDIGKVKVSFIGDDRDLLDVDMVPGDLPINVDIDVSGVRRLIVRVSQERTAYVDLIDMILSK